MHNTIAKVLAFKRVRVVFSRWAIGAAYWRVEMLSGFESKRFKTRKVAEKNGGGSSHQGVLLEVIVPNRI